MYNVSHITMCKHKPLKKHILHGYIWRLLFYHDKKNQQLILSLFNTDSDFRLVPPILHLHILSELITYCYCVCVWISDYLLFGQQRVFCTLCTLTI